MTEPKRRPGRPKTTGTTPLLSVRVPKAVQDAAKAKAKQCGEPFAAVVTRLLAEYAAGDTESTPAQAEYAGEGQ